MIATTPFINWLQKIDFQRDPEFFKRYRYDLLPDRPDSLDRWLWETSEVLEITGSRAKLKSRLGIKEIPVHCLRVLERITHEKTETQS